ncbi:hypothetical protein HDU91_001831, partial [Kappamyces sp. JEL0680]
MLFLHLFNNAIFSNPREQAITFKFCYLVVSLHIMCSFHYLDLPRQVLTVILGQKKPNDPEATVHQQMQLSVTKSVSWEARTPGRREKVLYNPELGAIDQVLEEYFNANTGLGKITATELARKNAQVFCLGRSPDKCLAAVEEIKKETGNKKIHFIQMDLMDLESVEAAADSFLASNLPLHKLILNAGIMIPPFQLTKQGLESQLGVNHFAHVVLANKLFKKLEESQPSRVVVLSSIAHGNAPYDGIHYDDLNNKDAYNAQQRYGESKLANLHFAKALQNKFTARNKDSQVFVNAVHP